MASEMIRRTKLLRWVKKEADKTEFLLKAVPDSEKAQIRLELLYDLCKEFQIDNDDLAER